MKDSLVYNIPATMVEAYRGRNIIVRSRDPAEVVRRLAGYDMEGLAYLQILGAEANIDDLLRWEHPVPVELVIEDPEVDLPRLYRYSPVSADRPVRVSVPVTAGFSKVVKLALSLNFAVKLELFQPEPKLIEPLLHIAEIYLRQSTISQPVDYIHSIFMAFYHGEPVSLWAVQEEDPSYNRFVTDKGLETISERFAGANLKGDLASFIKGFTEELLDEDRECGDCRFFRACLGYFKWPVREYRCDGVKTIFEMLSKAAVELKRDLSLVPSPRGKVRP